MCIHFYVSITRLTWQSLDVIMIQEARFTLYILDPYSMLCISRDWYWCFSHSFLWFYFFPLLALVLNWINSVQVVNWHWLHVWKFGIEIYNQSRIKKLSITVVCQIEMLICQRRLSWRPSISTEDGKILA